MDLINWALRTSPKFTTGVKYQFRQGFWPDQRSGNTNHPSPPSFCNKRLCEPLQRTHLQRPLLKMSPTAGAKRRGEGILRMEDAGTSEEDDDIDSQNSNTPIDHGHLARNYSMKIISPAVKASVISSAMDVHCVLYMVII